MSARLRVLTDARRRLRRRRPRRHRAPADRRRQGRLPRRGEPRAAHAAHADQGLPAHVDASAATSSTPRNGNIYEVMLREEPPARAARAAAPPASSLEEAGPPSRPRAPGLGRRCSSRVESIQREEPTREFSVDASPTICRRSMADDHLTAQVLANLLSNAVKFSPDGIAGRSDGRVRARARRSRRSPTGPGIAGDDRERIFEKFTGSVTT